MGLHSQSDPIRSKWGKKELQLEIYITIKFDESTEVEILYKSEIFICPVFLNTIF